MPAAIPSSLLWISLLADTPTINSFLDSPDDDFNNDNESILMMAIMLMIV